MALLQQYERCEYEGGVIALARDYLQDAKHRTQDASTYFDLHPDLRPYRKEITAALEALQMALQTVWTVEQNYAQRYQDVTGNTYHRTHKRGS